jgi:hypothetical protein
METLTGKITGINTHMTGIDAVVAADLAVGATPTKAEYDALVGKFNAVLALLQATIPA